MKDYVIKINDVPAFRLALKAEYEAGSTYVHEAEVDGELEYKLNITKTGVLPNVGVATVSISRLSPEELAWGESLPQVQIIGEAKDQYIKEIDDIEWITNGKGLYHAIHLQNPITYQDEDGNDIIYTPPLLHCIIGS